MQCRRSRRFGFVAWSLAWGLSWSSGASPAFAEEPCGTCRPKVRLVYDATRIPGGEICDGAFLVHVVRRQASGTCFERDGGACDCRPRGKGGCFVEQYWAFDASSCAQQATACAGLSSYHHACVGPRFGVDCPGVYRYTTRDWPRVVAGLSLWLGTVRAEYCCGSVNRFGLICGSGGSGTVIAVLEVTCGDCVDDAARTSG